MSRPSSFQPDSVNMLTRRTVLKAGATLLLSLVPVGLVRAAQIVAVRVWPAADYTRVTLENDSKLKATHFLVKDPNRLVVEIEGVDLDPQLKSLLAKIQPNDPYIAQVRAGQNRPGVVRLVFDLKEEIRPQVFTLEPIGEYKHRLIFDLYPQTAPDPIAQLLDEYSKTPPVVQPKSPPDDDPAQKLTRIITIALDPGHGGEDPGAVGSGGGGGPREVGMSQGWRSRGARVKCGRVGGR